jgi:hypothetical protein
MTAIEILSAIRAMNADDRRFLIASLKENYRDDGTYRGEIPRLNPSRFVSICSGWKAGQIIVDDPLVMTPRLEDSMKTNPFHPDAIARVINTIVDDFKVNNPSLSV